MTSPHDPYGTNAALVPVHQIGEILGYRLGSLQVEHRRQMAGGEVAGAVGDLQLPVDLELREKPDHVQGGQARLLVSNRSG
jgi:hypothetical protein